MKNNKICLITHAESDISKITAIELAKSGFHMVLASHDEKEGQEAHKYIIEKSGSELVDLLYMNPYSLDGIKEFSKKFNEKYNQLDILINIDHYITGKRRITEDGFEVNFAFNFLNNYVLIGELLDLILKSESSRIINTGSQTDKINFDDIQYENNFSAILASSHVHTLSQFFSYKLAKLLSNTNTTVNCAIQGALADENDYEGIEKLTVIAKQSIQKLLTVDKRGASDIIYLATSDEVKGISGKLFSNHKQLKILPSNKTLLEIQKGINDKDESVSEENLIIKAEHVWEIAEKLSGYKYNTVN